MEKKLAEDKRKYAELTLPWIESEAAKKNADAAEAKRQEALKGIAREKDHPAKTKAPNRDAGLEEMSGVFGGPRKFKGGGARHS